MAYRRRHQLGTAGGTYTYNYDFDPPPADSPSSSSASSLATKAIRASSAYKDSSLSSVYEQSALSSPHQSASSSAKETNIHDQSPKKNMNESKQGFWGAIARKAKAILDDENTAQTNDTPGGTTPQMSGRAEKDQYNAYSSQKSRRKTEGPAIQKGLDAIASSLNYIGGTIGNAIEEGITKVENCTADIIQETCTIQIRKKSGSSISQNQASDLSNLRQPPMTQARMQSQAHTDLETQLEASRDD